VLLPAVTAILYTLMTDPIVAVPLILVEATGFAFLNPAVYAVVAANSPPGRSSTAQGLFGAAGTLGFIVASITAGILAERSILLPFYEFGTVMTVALGLALVVGGARLNGRATEPAPAAVAVG
jgi:MFS family permease